MLIAIVLVTVLGIGGIVKNAEEVIDGNKLRGEIVQRELDHLNWANKINKLLTDEGITHLNVETDHQRCAFGKWYYSDARHEAEELVPPIKSLLSKIEEPHKRLHASAKDISFHFKQAHAGLALTLANRVQDHIQWVGKVSEQLAIEAGGLYRYQTLVKNAVEQSLSVIESIDNEAGPLTKQQKQEKAIEVLRSMRFGADKKDYIFTVNSQVECVMHPFKPNLEGTSLSKIQDPNGKFLFSDMVKLCEENKNGFLTYSWPLPGTSINAPKLTFVALYKPWNWIIGSGVFIDHTDELLIQRVDQFAKMEPYSLGVETNHQKCGLGKFLNDPKTIKLRTNFPELDKALTDCDIPHKKLHGYAIEIEELVSDLKTDEAIKLYKEKVIPTLAEVKASLEEGIAAENNLLLGSQKANEIYASITHESLIEIQEIFKEVNEKVTAHVMTDAQMLHAASNTKNTAIIISIIAIILGIVIASLIGKGIVKALNSIIDRLAQGSRQVSSASHQIAQSSESMATGASEQASSIEETSSSLEEISSMIKENAKSTNEANSLVNEASMAGNKGLEAMDRMGDAINKIKNSSDETAKIVKTIDEIAFQTNILALNAAVEAARAGEAGAGFAVVAEEVRNLAQRSAEAARNTTGLIQESQLNANNGVTVSQEVAKLLSQMGGSIENVTELIGHVNVATAEQSQGIDQVNTAVAQMNEVTQSNAASAEQAASASVELSAQAKDMDETVQILANMTGSLQETDTESVQINTSVEAPSSSFIDDDFNLLK